MKSRKLSVFTALLMAVALLTGCMKSEVNLTLNADDTASGDMLVAIDREMFTDEDEMRQFFEEVRGEIPDGLNAEPYDDGQFVGERYTFENMALTESQNGPGLSVRRAMDEYVVLGEIDMTEESVGSGVDLSNATVKWSVTFPGEVIEHNRALEGNTLTWSGVPGEFVNVEAIGKAAGISPPPSSSGGDDAPATTGNEPSAPTNADTGAPTDADSSVPLWLWFVIGGAGLVTIVAVVLLIVLRRRKPAPNSYHSPYGGPAAPPPPPPPTPGDGA